MGLLSWKPGALNVFWLARRKCVAVVVALLTISLWIFLGVHDGESALPTLITSTARRGPLYKTGEQALATTGVDTRVLEETSLMSVFETDEPVHEITDVNGRAFEQIPSTSAPETDEGISNTGDAYRRALEGTTSTGNQKAISDLNITVVTEIQPHRLYLYSAILRNTYKIRGNVTFQYDLVLTGWLHKQEHWANYICCVWMQDNEIIPVNVSKTNDRNLKPTLRATEFLCTVTHSSSVRSVTIVTRGSACPQIPDLYLQLYTPGAPRPGLAVCSKIGYWALDAKYLVEWFEIVRLLGASKVISYTYELNDDAMKVLQYYEHIGLADIYAFDYPDKVRVPRMMSGKTSQNYHDKSVAVYDCVERLANYQFVTVMDKDEIILPETDNLYSALLRFLETQLRDDPSLGSLSFYTQMHHISGEPLPGNTMYTHHYHNCSRPILDRQKNIYLPHRVIPGSISTHTLTVARGYKSKTVRQDQATTHHYRKPRSSYVGGIHDLENNMSCPVMRRLSDLVQEATTTTRLELGLV